MSNDQSSDYMSHNDSSKDQGSEKHGGGSSYKSWQKSGESARMIPPEQDISMSNQEPESFDSPSIVTKHLEMQILVDLETTEVFKMRDRIKRYIEENVQVERNGLNYRIKSLNEKNNQLKKYVIE